MISNLSDRQAKTLNRQFSFNNPKLVEVGIVLLLALATVIINLKMIRDGLNGVGDLLWHITWVQHFSKQIAEGIWYPRWLAGTNYGYGSPTFVFYPPLVYYIGSAFKLLGLNIEQTMAVLFSLGIFGSGLSFYIYGRDKWGRIAAFIGALFYMTCPGIAALINGGGLAFLFAFPLLPLGLYLTDQALGQPKWRVALAIFWVIIPLTHVPSLLIYAIAWFFYILLSLLNRPWKAVIATLLSAGIGLGIASFYLLPAILEQSFVNIEYMRASRGGFQAQMLKISELMRRGLSDSFVQQLLALGIFTVISLKCFRKNATIIRQIGIWLAFAMVVFFLMTEWSWFIWKSSRVLQMIQSPGRLGVLLYFGEAALCGLAVSGILQQRLRFKILPLLIIIGIILVNFKFGYQLSRSHPTLHNPGKGTIVNLERLKTALYEPYADKLIDVPEYRPALGNNPVSPPTPIIGQPKVSVMSGQAEIQIARWQSYTRTFNITAETTATIRVRTYYYPAWHLYVNQNSHPIDMSSDGTIQLQLEPGFYTVELRHQWTRAFTLGVVLSLLSIIALVLYWINIFKTSERALSFSLK